MKSLLLVALVGCSWSGVEGSGKARSDVRPVKGFDAIELSGAINAEIAIAADHRVEISGDDNLVPLITTELDGSTLEIEARKSMRPQLPLIAHLTAPKVGALTASGSKVVTLHRMQGEALALQLSGSVTLRGGGKVGKLSLVISGSANVDLDQLSAEDVTVAVTGSGNVAVAASRSLAVDISGAATVTYRGDPSVTQNVSGAGRVVKR